MKVFRNLIFRGTSDQLAATVDAIQQAMPENAEWQRDRALEQMLRTDSASWSKNGGPEFCFACIENDRRPAASLCISRTEADTFHVSNILPAIKRRLAVDEYNDILKEFFDRFVQPALEKTGLSAELTESNVGLEQWLSAEAAEKLAGFSMTREQGHRLFPILLTEVAGMTSSSPRTGTVAS